MNKKSFLMLMITMVLNFSACGGGDDFEGGNNGGGNNRGNNGGGSNSNMGVDNTTDMAVTGGVQEIGMTYADVIGYINNMDDVRKGIEDANANFIVGVYYGESEYSMNKRAYGALVDSRTYIVTIPGLEAGKTYYYKSLLEWDHPAFTYEDYLSHKSEFFIAEGKETGKFTTKQAAFEGKISANPATNITFLHAKASGSIDLSSLNKKETYIQGFAYSSNKSSLTGQLADRLERSEMAYPDMYSFTSLRVDGDLFFETDGDLEATLEGEGGSTVYYSPYLIISGKSFTGEIGEAKLRDLPVRDGFVDLGLGVKWAAVNLNASSPWDTGGTRSEDGADYAVKEQFGSNAMMPTKEQVLELAEKCTIKEIDNGLLITGPNGNQIFLPLMEKFGNTGSEYLTGSRIKEEIESYPNSKTVVYSHSYAYKNGQITVHKKKTYDSKEPSRYSSLKGYIRAVSDDGSGSATYDGCPNSNHPHEIDLGLPSGKKWACCNVGAISPEKYGGYYAWGEVIGKTEYSWDTYQYGNSDTDCDNLGADISGIIEYDVAFVSWGNSWKMPTKANLQELTSNTDIEWVSDYKGTGAAGYKFTNKEDASKYIFLPAAGNGSGSGQGLRGYYWSSTSTQQSGGGGAYSLYFSDVTSPDVRSNLSRCNGMTVRAVK